MSVVTYPKSTEVVAFNNLKVGAFIDNSGSTSYKYKDKTILQSELELVSSLSPHNTIFWNNIVNITNTPYSAGCTEPSCIFSDTQSSKIYDESDVIVFTTDGEIGQNSVTNFSSKLSSKLDKILFVCLIIGAKRCPSNVNISVLAPLMMSNSYLVLFHNENNNKTYVLASRGSISNIYPSPKSYDSWDILQEIDLNDLKKITLTKQNLPNNHIMLSDNGSEYKLLDVSNLTDISELNLTDTEWKCVFNHCKVTNQTGMVRNLLTNNQTRELEQAKDNISFGKYTKEYENIMNELISAQQSNDKDLQMSLREKLKEIRKDYESERVEYNNYVKTVLLPIRQKYGSLQSMLCETEKSSYNIASFASNRAARAEFVADLDDEELCLVHNGPEIDCMICLDKGPAVLWLNKCYDLEKTTNDYVIDFPLSKHYTLQGCIVSNPVCGNCADTYLKLQKQSVFRQPIYSYIPCNIKFNSDYVQNVLARTFTGGKNMNHLKMLLLSILDDFDNEWVPFKDYMIDNLIRNITTTGNFSGDGKRMGMIGALNNVIKSDDNIYRQPILGAKRILKFVKQYKPNLKLVCEQLLNKKFNYFLVERYAQLVRKYNDNFKTVNSMIENILFDTFCNIPIENKVKEIILSDLQKYIECDDVFVDLKNIDMNMCRNILYRVYKSTSMDRPMNLYNSIISKSILTDDNIFNDKFGSYKQGHHPTPFFVVNNGEFSSTTKLHFSNEPLWTDDMNGKTFSITDLAEQFSNKLREKMTETYGSYYPTNKSNHIMIHRIVAKVLENNFPNKDFCDEMIVECYREYELTSGNYGNIHKNNILCCTIELCKQFCNLRKQQPPFFDHCDKSVEHKLKCELASYGMDINGNNVLFDVSKIRKPEFVKLYDVSKEYMDKINDMYLAKY